MKSIQNIYNYKTKNSIRRLSLLSINKFLSILSTSLRGLTQDSIEGLIKIYGKNIIEKTTNFSYLKSFYNALTTPFNLILFVLMIVSIVTYNTTSSIVMLIMICIGAFLCFWQEVRANKESSALKRMVTNKVTVIRQINIDGNLVSKQFDISIDNVIPGDIIHLSAGDMIPGDVRIISSKDLFISQSALTGETFPIEKHAGLKSLINNDDIMISDLHNNSNEESIFIDYPNICFMGSSVVSGTATAVVFNIGSNTIFGDIASKLSHKEQSTHFIQEIDKIGFLLVRFILLLVPMIFLLNGFIKGNWTDAFLFSISVAVGLTPEMLPVIVNSNLARGAILMSQKKAIVKKLNAIQDFGSMNVLCTDKTGTLTQDKVVLLKYLNVNCDESTEVLKNAFLNSHFQTGLKNLLDSAVIESSKHNNINDIKEKYKVIDEIPFDFIRKRMSVILENIENNSRIMLCKGATDEMFNKCSFVDNGNGDIIPISNNLRKKIIDIREKLFNDGLRVIAVAYKKIKQNNKDHFFIEDESDLIFSGYIAFLDPPKDTAIKALLLLKNYGVEIKILTGDNLIVTQAVCKKVDLIVKKFLTGPEIDLMDDNELSNIINDITVFARMSPQNKSRIVSLLRSKGNIVGFLGDGINDALAMREANVGISVDTGTDIAKESADVILLDKDLVVLNEAVLIGRQIFGNIIKYIKITCSSNFGNVLSLLVASVTLPFLPMLPVQLLIQNLLYDISQTVMPWDKVDNSFLLSPKYNYRGDISRFMFYIGSISTIFDMLMFSIMWFILGFNTSALQSFFHTGWFIEGLLTQILIVHMVRTERIPFINSTASLPIIMMSLLVVTLGLLVPFYSFSQSLGFVQLPFNYFPWLLLIIFSYCIFTQICKIIYIKRFKIWI